MIYHQVLPIERDEGVRVLAHEPVERACEALLSVAYFEDDWRWAEALFLDLIADETRDRQLRRVAVICLGHLGRIHRRISRDTVIPVLKQLKKHDYFGESAENALDDLRYFVKK